MDPIVTHLYQQLTSPTGSDNLVELYTDPEFCFNLMFYHDPVCNQSATFSDEDITANGLDWLVNDLGLFFCYLNNVEHGTDLRFEVDQLIQRYEEAITSSVPVKDLDGYRDMVRLYLDCVPQILMDIFDLFDVIGADEDTLWRYEQFFDRLAQTQTAFSQQTIG